MVTKERRRKCLADGKPYGGACGRMTKTMEQKLAEHYGLAIQQTSKLVKSIKSTFHHSKTKIFLDLDEDKALSLMEKNCRAAFLHNVKQDDPEVQHDLCPKGRDSWCSFHQDKYLSLPEKTDTRKNVKRLDHVSTRNDFLIENIISFLFTGLLRFVNADD